MPYRRLHGSSIVNFQFSHHTQHCTLFVRKSTTGNLGMKELEAIWQFLIKTPKTFKNGKNMQFVDTKDAVPPQQQHACTQTACHSMACHGWAGRQAGRQAGRYSLDVTRVH